MYTLYGMTGSCSMAVHVILNEIGQEVNYVDVRAEKPAAFLKANPRGSVPVITEGDFALREGGAIITYLCDTHNSPLLPKSGHARGTALEWLMFANATMHPAYGKIFHAASLKDENAKKLVIDGAIEKVNQLWKDVDGQLAKTGAFIAGKDITPGDILLSVIANWARDNFATKIPLPANVKRLVAEVSARPAFQKALGEEKVEYKAAA